MAARIEQIDGDKVFKLILSGELIADDYDVFLPEMEAAIKKHLKISLLVDLCDLKVCSPGAIFADLKFDVKHFFHFKKIAIIGDNKWQERLARVSKPFTGAEVHYFDCSCEESARDWLTGGAGIFEKKAEGKISQQPKLSVNDVLWKRYATRVDFDTSLEGSARRRTADQLHEDYVHLEHRVEKLSLICRSLWELLSDGEDLDEDDLLSKVKEIDSRDGEIDGVMRTQVIACSVCGHNVNTRHPVCVYCGNRALKKDLFAEI